MPVPRHHEILRDPSGIATAPSVGGLRSACGEDVGLALVEDPRTTARTSIIGMFVLRPATIAWSPRLGDVPAALRSGRDWCSSVRGIDGSGILADGNALDAWRLALQYGLCDAVIVGSGTVVAEGIGDETGPGWLWQPYGPAAWPQLAPFREGLLERIEEVRAAWQSAGLLSPRDYPAQIVVSRSGRAATDGRDLLDADLFSARHPDGSPVECRVLTSRAGAARMRARAGRRDLAGRLDEILIDASPADDPEALDLAAVPRLLRERLDVRIANHDGGRTVLAEFVRAGALAQLNLTLMRGRAVRDVIAGTSSLDADRRATLLAEFEARRELFFSGDHRLPESLEPVHVLEDDAEAVVVSFDARGMRCL